MAQAMQFLSSSPSSSSTCASRPSASIFGVARQHGRGPAGSACISLKNVGQRLLLPREADVQQLMMKGRGSAQAGAAAGKQAAGAGVVRAASTLGVVEDVRMEVKGMYYNVTLSIDGSSDVAKWYHTPGQYAELLPTNSKAPDGSFFFIASPVRPVLKQGERLRLEFLIEVAGIVSTELANSKPGDTVCVSTVSFSDGFNVSKLQPIEAAESVLMFASGYGLGPVRALIETGFQAKERKHAILYTIFSQNQEPYMEKHPAWQATGVEVAPFQNKILQTDPAKTVVVLVATVDEQERLIEHFVGKGVPYDKILTLFEGITRTDKTYINKVLGKPNFPAVGKLHVPFALKI